MGVKSSGNACARPARGAGAYAAAAPSGARMLSDDHAIALQQFKSCSMSETSCVSAKYILQDVSTHVYWLQ